MGDELSPDEADLMDAYLGGKGDSHHRRGSRWSRRGSSVEHSRRRLSSYTTSSGDTAVELEDSEAEVRENIRFHKSVIETCKQQPWPISRKYHMLRTAKAYIKKHEGELAHSKQAKDIFATWRIFVRNTIHRLQRELADMVVTLTPWEMRIKRIESHFGSVVASYFVFLRWVFWLNGFITIFISCFLMVPEVLRADEDITGMRKKLENDEAQSALNFQAVWEFEGYLKYSPIFYGYYSDTEMTPEGYRLPLAYLLSSLIMYIFSFFVILRKMAKNNRQSKMTEKDDECTFAWKLFAGWDYMIGNAETAHNKVASLVMSLKESVLEEKERKKEERSWKMVILRIFANILVLILFMSSAYAVVLVVERSEQPEAQSSWYRQNEVTIVVSAIGLVYPNLFDLVGLIESYHPRIQLRWQLARIMVLNMLNLYTLIFSLFRKVSKMTTELSGHRSNITELLDVGWFDRSDEILNDTILLLTTTTPSPLKTMILTALETKTIHPNCSFQAINCTTISYLGLNISEFLVQIPLFTTTETTLFDDVMNDTLINGTIYDFVNDSSTTTQPPPTTTPFYEFFHQIIANMTMLGITNWSYITPVETKSFDPVLPYVEIPEWSFINITSNETTITSTESEFEPDCVRYIWLCGISLDDFRTTTTQFAAETSTQRVLGSPPKPYDFIKLDKDTKDRLRKLCWETMFGQEMVKLTVMDLVMTIVSTIAGDFIRALVVRFCSGYCCWDMEKGFPGYGDFKIAENVLHLVNNQGMIWMGMFFSPGLPAINMIKLCILMYVRSWAVLTCNIPHETVFKASGSNNFYFALLLMMLFICTLPVGYAMVWLEPSWHCGPFSGYPRVYKVVTYYLSTALPDWMNGIIEYLTSAAVVIPLILLLILIIYYLVSVTGSLRESNNDLKNQIRREKEGLRKKPGEEEEKKDDAPTLDLETIQLDGEEEVKATQVVTLWAQAARRQAALLAEQHKSPLQKAIALAKAAKEQEEANERQRRASSVSMAARWGQITKTVVAAETRSKVEAHPTTAGRWSALTKTLQVVDKDKVKQDLAAQSVPKSKWGAALGKDKGQVKDKWGGLLQSKSAPKEPPTVVGKSKWGSALQAKDATLAKEETTAKTKEPRSIWGTALKSKVAPQDKSEGKPKGKWGTVLQSKEASVKEKELPKEKPREIWGSVLQAKEKPMAISVEKPDMMKALAATKELKKGKPTPKGKWGVAVSKEAFEGKTTAPSKSTSRERPKEKTQPKDKPGGVVGHSDEEPLMTKESPPRKKSPRTMTLLESLRMSKRTKVPKITISKDQSGMEVEVEVGDDVTEPPEAGPSSETPDRDSDPLLLDPEAEVYRIPRPSLVRSDSAEKTHRKSGEEEDIDSKDQCTGETSTSTQTPKPLKRSHSKRRLEKKEEGPS